MTAATEASSDDLIARLPIHIAIIVDALRKAGVEFYVKDYWRTHRRGMPASVVVYNAPMELWPMLRANGFTASGLTHMKKQPSSMRNRMNIWDWDPDTDPDTIEQTPVVGMPMTYSIGGDSYAGHVTRIEHKGRWVFYRIDGRMHADERKAILHASGVYRPRRNIGQVFFGKGETSISREF